MRDVEGCLDGAPVGVSPALEEFLEESPIQVIDGVVESEEDKLRDVVLVESAGDVGASAVAVRQLAVRGIATIGRRLRVRQRHQ